MDHYLRIDTSDRTLRKDDDYQQSQLLTPLPSATEGRRSSIASSGQWSFMSCPGSVSSFESSQGPTTPPSTDNSLAGGYQVVTSADMSFDGLAFASQALRFKSSFDNIPPAAPCTPVSPAEGFGTQSNIDWPWPRVSVPQSFHLSQHTTMPAASDFGNAFESSLGFNIHDARPVSRTNAYDYSMTAADLHIPITAGQSSLDFLYEPSPNEALSFPGIGLDHLREPYAMTTIAPSDAFMQEQSSPLAPVKDLRPAFGQCGYDFSSRSPSPLEQLASNARAEQDPDYTPSKRSRTSRAICETPRGGKSVSKRMKTRTSAARRRHREAIKYEVCRNDSKEAIAVTYEGDYKTTENGYLVAATKKVAKKQCCGKALPNGTICQAAFERVEHLKRHQHTHTLIKDFACPKCPREFNRNDNLQEHYKTHLLPSKSGRNERTTFEEMFSLIREFKSPEVAENAIKALATWRSSPKYMADLQKASAR